MKRIIAGILLCTCLSGLLPVYAAENSATAQEVYGSANNIPVYKTSKEIVLDGDDSEWADVDEFPMLHKSVFGADTGMTATTQLLYDENNLYILVKTDDAEHWSNPEDSRYWDADALQFSIMETIGATYGSEGAVVYRPEKNEIYMTTRGNIAEKTKCISAEVVRKGTETIYEIAVDWNFHFGEVPKEMLFNTALADGDSGPIRESSIEMRPGTITGKNGTGFQRVVLLEEKQSFYAYIDGARREQTAAEYSYDICVYNTSNLAQTYTIKSDEKDFSLTVDSGSVGRLPRTTVFDGAQEIEEVKAVVSCGEEVREISQAVQVEANEAYYWALVDRLKEYSAELTDLVNQCNLKKIPTEYEEQVINVIGFYIRELGFDYETKDFSRLIYYSGVFDELYQNTKAELEAYLNGEKVAVSVPLMADSDHSSEGHHFTAETTQGNRPVFYLAAMTDYNWAYESIPYLSGMGFNMTNPALGATYNLGHKGVIAPYPSTWGRGTNQFLPEELQDKHSADVVCDNGENYAVISGDFDMNDYPNISTHFGFTQWVDLEPGEVYEFGARVKADNVQFAHLSLSGQKTGAGTIGNMGGTYDWKNVKGEFTAGSSTRVPVCIRSWGHGTFMADDVYVRNKRTGENLVINGDFQHDVVRQGERSGQWFAVNPDFLDDLEKQLKECEDRNLAVNLMLGTASLYELWTLDDMVTEGGTSSPFAAFIKFNPHHPIVLDALEIWLDVSFVDFAKLIKEKTGKAGFVMPTANGSGGWLFTALAWSFGVDFMEKDAEGKWKATFNTPEAAEALQFVKDMKWEHDILPSNTLIDGGEWQKIFGAGNAGITFAAGEYPANVVPKFGIKPEQIGLIAMPKGPQKHVTLLAGDIICVSNAATEDQIDAAVRWMGGEITYKATEEYKVNKQKEIEAKLSNNQIVGVKGISVWSEDAEALKYEHQLIDEKINVNPNQVKLYNEFAANCPCEIRPEEPVNAQELYKILDSCIQEVLTNKDADVKKVLEKANADFQANYLDNLTY